MDPDLQKVWIRNIEYSGSGSVSFLGLPDPDLDPSIIKHNS
jgi:hypothetical protein